MLHDNIAINEQGHLTFAGQDTVALAKTYGTPLYLLDENRIRARMRLYKNEMKACFGGESGPLFAGKSICFKGMYRIAKEEGIGIDVVSPGELYTAKSAGFPMEKAFFHGNNKTDADIAFAMEAGVGTFVSDSKEELDQIDRTAKEKGIVQNVLLRLSPGIDPHTFAAVNTGKVDSKFGFAIATGQAEEAVAHALSLSNVKLLGFHCHIGSQIFESKPFCDAADVMMRFIANMSKRFHTPFPVLNLGGGFGVKYVESDPELDFASVIRAIAIHVRTLSDTLSVPMPCIFMEPGRSIVADAGMTLYTVGTTKTITGYKNYVSVDGGMPDNPRYALYGSKYTFYVANKANETADFECTIAGRCCESGDLLGENVLLPRPARGDILATAVTGAYNYAMASNYNRLPRPALVRLFDGKHELAVRRETYEDLIRLDL